MTSPVAIPTFSPAPRCGGASCPKLMPGIDAVQCRRGPRDAPAVCSGLGERALERGPARVRRFVQHPRITYAV
jgi:hypothetical protein